MSRYRYAVSSNTKRSRITRAALCGSFLWAFSLPEPTSAQVQRNSPQSGATESAGLAECSQLIPLAKELMERIVDHIKSPRPDFKCSDFGKITWEGSKLYSIIRISNPQFCQDKYCYTVIYNEQTKSIMFSLDAENLVDYFKYAKDHIISIKPIINHAFENNSNGLLLSGRDGLIAISVFNEILTISVVPKKGGQ
jgi:hypothetical protein